MVQVVGVRFRRTGRIYSFKALDEVVVGDEVVVQTERGPELGTVVTPPTERENGESLRPVLRRATEEDREAASSCCHRAGGALEEARRQVARLGLPMKMLGAEYSLDGSRLTLYFSAEGRVDFRDLVRELASIFHTRIEMRQVGPRDESKILGGIGQCGQELCCHRWLTEFTPVSIRMAKEQDLALNPLKISGLCGRLLCCLSYEMGQYIQAREKLPRRGQRVLTPMGPAQVVGGNPLKETVTVRLESEAVVEVPLSQVQRGG
ncbi:MAG: regulatory iron-sulfur-containing complex subunit RicT [Dehalococcoidia bacterium]